MLSAQALLCVLACVAWTRVHARCTLENTTYTERKKKHWKAKEKYWEFHLSFFEDEGTLDLPLIITKSMLQNVALKNNAPILK